MTRVAAAPRFIVDQIATTQSPVPDKEISVSSAGALIVAGWAADFADGPVSGVEVAIDQKPFPATYGVARQDVATALKNPAFGKSGFILNIPAIQFSNGVHIVTVRIMNKDKNGYYETPAYHVRVE